MAVVALVFTIALARQYAARRKSHQAVWAVALGLGFAGALGYLVASAGSAAGFRLYYLAGALWMAPAMGLGSLYLHFGPSRIRYVTLGVLGLGLVGTWGVLTAPLDAAALAALEGDPGAEVLDLGGLSLASLVILNTFGVVTVGGLALRSALAVRRVEGGRGFLMGNLMLAAGVLLLGTAGSLARLGVPGSFWLLMALGFVLLYAGFARIEASSAAARKGRAEEGPAARA